MFLKFLHADGRKDMAELVHTFSQLSVASALKMSDSQYLRHRNWLYLEYKKGKTVPLQDWTGPEGSRKLRLPDFMTTAQDGGRLSDLRTGRL
jgi:hypothetical protein